MREYELNIIVQPEISEEGSAAILGRLDAALESSSIRLCCDDLGKRKLAYEISRFQKGHYYLLSFLDDGQAVPDLERMLRLDEFAGCAPCQAWSPGSPPYPQETVVDAKHAGGVAFCKRTPPARSWKHMTS